MEAHAAGVGIYKRARSREWRWGLPLCQFKQTEQES